MKLYWTDEALKSLREIKRYIADDNPKSAETLVEAVFKTAEQLKEFPELGRKVAEFPERNLREMIHKRYRIVYQIKDDKYLFWLFLKVIVVSRMNSRRKNSQMLKSQENQVCSHKVTNHTNEETQKKK